VGIDASHMPSLDIGTLERCLHNCGVVLSPWPKYQLTIDVNARLFEAAQGTGGQ
jgi:hypothetical protein